MSRQQIVILIILAVVVVCALGTAGIAAIVFTAPPQPETAAWPTVAALPTSAATATPLPFSLAPPHPPTPLPRPTSRPRPTHTLVLPPTPTDTNTPTATHTSTPGPSPTPAPTRAPTRTPTFTPPPATATAAAYPYQPEGQLQPDPSIFCPMGGSVMGHIRDAEGNPLEGVRVWHYSDTWEAPSVSFSKSGPEIGQYDVPLTYGTWHIVIVDENFQPLSPAVTLSIDASTICGFRLDWRKIH